MFWVLLWVGIKTYWSESVSTPCSVEIHQNKTKYKHGMPWGEGCSILCRWVTHPIRLSEFSPVVLVNSQWRKCPHRQSTINKCRQIIGKKIKNLRCLWMPCYSPAVEPRPRRTGLCLVHMCLISVPSLQPQPKHKRPVVELVKGKPALWGPAQRGLLRFWHHTLTS